MVLGGHRAGAKELIRFLAEAEAVAAVKHPHVVQVYEYGEADGRPFLAMEFLSGGSLSDRLKRTADSTRSRRRGWWRRWPGRCRRPTIRASSTAI